jgi:hypothetical protein
MEFKRLFTQQEAESTLPLVRRIVADILAAGAALRELDEDDPRAAASDPRAVLLRTELQDCFAELEAIGCTFKDWSFTVGLVDFPAVIDGRQVFLCWRSDEPGLAWYHGIGDGYRGRKPLRGPAAG